MKIKLIKVQKSICIFFVSIFCFTNHFILINAAEKYYPQSEHDVDGEYTKDGNGVTVRSHYQLRLYDYSSIKNEAYYKLGCWWELSGATTLYSDAIYINGKHQATFTGNNGDHTGGTVERGEWLYITLKSGKNSFETRNVAGVGGESGKYIYIDEFATAPTIVGTNGTWKSGEVSSGLRTWQSLYTDGATGSEAGNKVQTSTGFMYFDEDEAKNGVNAYSDNPIGLNSGISKIVNQNGTEVSFNEMDKVGTYMIYTYTSDSGGLEATGTRVVNVVESKYIIQYDGNGARSGSTGNTICKIGINCNLTANSFKKYYNVTYNSNGGTSPTTNATANAKFLGWQDHNSYSGEMSVNYLVFDAPYYANKHPDVKQAFGYDKTALYGHWLTTNINNNKENRQSSPYFQIGYYMQNGGQDLINIFREHRPSYVNHFQFNGYKEGRSGASSVDTTAQDYYEDQSIVKDISQKGNTTATLKAKWKNGSVTLPTPTRPGYTFIGWYEGSSNKGKGGATYEPPGDKTLIAKWDKNPTIEAIDKTFYEGEYTNKEWIDTIRMQDVSASDQEDGNITSKIKVIYDDVNVDLNGVYKVTYQVSDSVGATVTKDIKVTVKFNNPPTITAEDRWFYQNEDVTDTRLLERVKADDFEDGDITRNAVIKSSNVQNHIIGTYQVTYRITDAFGKSAETSANIHIVTAIPVGDDKSTYLRFIDKPYINTLKENSTWKSGERATLLNNTLFNPQVKEHWTISSEDIKRMQDFNNSHDFSPESNSLFYETFSQLIN